MSRNLLLWGVAVAAVVVYTALYARRKGVGFLEALKTDSPSEAG